MKETFHWNKIIEFELQKCKRFLVHFVDLFVIHLSQSMENKPQSSKT